MWLLLIGLTLLAGDVIAQGAFQVYGPGSTSPLRPIAQLATYHDYTPQVVASPIRNVYSSSNRPSFRPRPSSSLSGNPCSPTPCGPNTRCEVANSGNARCRCLTGYVPDKHTINGCKPQCQGRGSNECPDDYQCLNNKCVRACRPGACALNADCQARNHKAVCSCPDNFGGDGYSSCRRIQPTIREPPLYEIDPCNPSPCGNGADCREREGRPVCSCPRGAEGNPLQACIRGECIEHEDCANHLACRGLRCIDPCQDPDMCGHGTDCVVRRHTPICSCPEHYIGNPFSSCRRITEDDVCNRDTCGPNTNCRARHDRGTGGLRAVCSCKDNFIGNPIDQRRGCYYECERDNDCAHNLGCRDNRCRNPCVDGCGTDSYCNVVNHRAVCTCPEFFKGDGYSRCYTECTAHSDCADHQACYRYDCVDPCVGECGSSAECRVENHQPICYCPKEMTGDPFVSCRLFTDADYCNPNPCGTNAECHPGTDRSGEKRPVCLCPTAYVGNPLVRCERGECTDHNQCPDNEACYAYQCQSPCFHGDNSVCGDDAVCRVKNHQPVCSCPQGFGGDPLRRCSLSPNARRPIGGGINIGYAYN